MNRDESYSIVISSGDLANDNLVAEIYLPNDIYIGSLFFNGHEIVFDVTCDTINELCRAKRQISLRNIIGAINRAIEELNLHVTPIVWQGDDDGSVSN